MSLIRHLVVQEDWNAKVGRDACGNWQGIWGPFCNDDTNGRGFRLLEFATFNDLVLANYFVHHKVSRRRTWHSPNRQHHNQIDWLHSSEKALSIRSEQCQTTKFSRGRHWEWSRLADDDLPPSPEKISKTKCTRLKFDLEKLKDPNVLETFQAMIGGKFALLTIMSNEDTDILSMVTTFNTAVTETASEILGKHRQ